MSTVTNFDNGISSYGIPVVGSGPILTTGDIWFVDSTASRASDGATAGKTPILPFASIDYAIGRATANNGDHILVLPGHAETVSAISGLDFDVAGLTVVGIGDGADTPTVTVDTTSTAFVDIGVASITLINLHFVANVANVSACIEVQAGADDFALRRCRFTETSSSLNFLRCVQVATSTVNKMIIDGCTFMTDGTNNSAITMAVATDGVRITNNFMTGNWSAAAIIAAGVSTNCIIADNIIFNVSVNALEGINVAVLATGVMCRNMVTCGHASSGIHAGDMGALENYYVQNTGSDSGDLNPAAV